MSDTHVLTDEEAQTWLDRWEADAPESWRALIHPDTTRAELESLKIKIRARVYAWWLEDPRRGETLLQNLLEYTQRVIDTQVDGAPTALPQKIHVVPTSGADLNMLSYVDIWAQRWLSELHMPVHSRRVPERLGDRMDVLCWMRELGGELPAEVTTYLSGLQEGWSRLRPRTRNPFEVLPEILPYCAGVVYGNDDGPTLRVDLLHPAWSVLHEWTVLESVEMDLP